MTRDELARTWERWTTGEPLDRPTPATAENGHQANGRRSSYDGEDDGLLDAVKRAWTAYDIFVHYGFDDNVVRESREKWRFRGHGGLIVDDPNGDSENIHSNSKHSTPNAPALKAPSHKRHVALLCGAQDTGEGKACEAGSVGKA